MAKKRGLDKEAVDGKKWYSSSYPGVRYRKHRKGKHGVKFDQYFTIRYKVDGKDKEEGIGWASEGVTAEGAAKILAEIRQSIRTGIGPKSLADMRSNAKKIEAEEEREKERRIRAELTFSQFWIDTYLGNAEATKKASSVYSEKWLYRLWIKPHIGDVPLTKLTSTMIKSLSINAIKAGKSPRTAQYILAVVSQVWNLAYDHNIVAGENPVRRIKKPRADNWRYRFLTPAEANRLLDALKNSSVDTYDAVVMSLFCGLRAGEIHSLTWGDVDLGNSTIFIKDPKSRHVIITDEVREVLLRRNPMRSKGEFVIPAEGGGRRKNISNTFKKAVKALGFNDGVTDNRQKVVFHSCRHTFASWLVQKKVPVYTVGKLLGHKTLAMTKRYSHLAPDNILQAACMLQGQLGQQKNNLIEFNNKQIESASK